MKTHRNPNALPASLALALLLALPGLAEAQQCDISGPSALCGGPITLCGPQDAIAWEWLLPDGSMQVTQCIDVSVPGTYQLHTFDLAIGNWGPWCTRTIGTSDPAPAINGPDGGCAGTQIQLCGPTGSLEYQWVGPAGFAASTSCVTVNADGDYQLRVRPLPDGCWSDYASRTLAFASCHQNVNCPRPVWWWAQQVPGHDQSGTHLSPELVASLAACVDDHDSYFSWSSAATGFGLVMNRESRALRSKAERQVAAVWANVCAGANGVTSADGRSVSLDPATTLSLPGVTGSVSSWLTQADAVLAQLANRREDRGVRDGYRALIRTAWSINHGLGIGAVCPAPIEQDALVSELGGEASSMSAISSDPEPLSVELLEESAAPLMFGALTPNPFSAMTRLAFAVSTSTTEDVSIGVYDVSGRLIRELVRGPYAPGQYEARWDGRATDGSSAKSGLYFILGRVGGQQIQTRVSFVH
jgi:hypothetical protein